MSAYEDRYWTSDDGLKLHYRDYPGRADRPPLLCLPGLTRNARDFAELAERYAGEWRVLCPEMRGRGDSEYARDSATYNPLQYVQDVIALLDQARVERVVAIGTSLGAIMTMLMAMTAPGRIVAAVLNDAGPVIDPEGLSRIATYVGQGRTFPTWVHAARGLEEMQARAHPSYELADWIEMAKRIMALSSNGRIVFDYDMKIAEPFQNAPAGPVGDLWPAFEALAGKPVLVVRGEASDILSAATLDAMAARQPGVEALTVSGVGHAPTLTEPEVLAAIDALLARLG